MNIAAILKEIDTDSFAEQLLKSRQLDNDKKQLFWQCTLCHNMISDLIRVHIGFDEEMFCYFPEKVQSMFGWETISHEDTKQFIHVMADSIIGVDFIEQDNMNNEDDGNEQDNEDMFDACIYIKKGIKVCVMYGQGRSVSIQPL